MYGLEESIIASGYPMLAKVPNDITADADELWFQILTGKQSANKHFLRAMNLGNATRSSGHMNFLKGIIVQADFEAPSYWWPQAQRYHWFEIVSSQSKIHRIAALLEDQYDARELGFNPAELYRDGEMSYEELMAYVPQDLELTARISTNYLQLQNMCAQRKTHKLKMWTDVFIPWVKTLPLTKELGVV